MPETGASMDYVLQTGSLPLLISMPHAGTAIPAELQPRLTETALQVPDTDWHLPLLYAGQASAASVLAAHWSRYVIDLNRPPQDTNLYPGQDTTGLLPLDSFHKQALYLPGQQPTPEEAEQRRQLYWQPYHDQLQAELARLQAIHGYAILWEAHSIASVVPRFFEGKLPDLNFGSADGRSCDSAMLEAVLAPARAQSQFSLAVNGRFKGGYITREYGKPEQGIHALQLEMCQSLYMDESLPFTYRPGLAEQVQPLLHKMLQAALNWGKTLPATGKLK